MSGGSIGTIVGGIVGGIAGWFVGGPSGAWTGASWGMTIGGGVGNALDPPKGPKNSGPRLGDLTVQTSTYGATIPRTYGTLALFGNVFWLENNKLKEVATTESSGGKGMPGMGGGGETTTYSYYATFALGLCEGPIIGIKRIWIGPKLFYDAGSTNKSTMAASKANEQYFRIYTGTDTQNADTRMQAALGAADVPAYRGLAYIVFYDLPLADYGNTLLAAQIKVEVVTNGSYSYAFDEMGGLSVGSENGYIVARAGFAYVSSSAVFGHSIAVVDVADPENPVSVGTLQTGEGMFSFTEPLGMAIDRRYLYVACPGGLENGLVIFDITNPYSVVLSSQLDTGGAPSHVHLDGGYAILTGSTWFQVVDIADRANPQLLLSIELANAANYVAIADGYLYAVTQSADLLSIYAYSGGVSEPSLVSETTISDGPTCIAVTGHYAYITCRGDRGLFVYDVADPENPVEVYSIVWPDIADGASYVTISGDFAFLSADVSGGQIYLFDISDPAAPVLTSSLPGHVNPSSLHVDGSRLYASYYAGAAMAVYAFGGPVITPDPVALSSIVLAESLHSNFLTTDDIDAATLTDLVRGYRVSEVAAIRAGIEPLRAAWPFDVVMHGYQIKFVRRGAASVATITEGELDAREAGAQPGVQITNSREMDYILPRKVSIKHFDVNREYDTGEQYAERINTDSVNMRDLELPIVLTAQEAAQKAEVLLYLYWMERYDIAINLPPDYSQLEPSDVITITATDATYELRLTSIAYTADGRLECKAKYNSAALYVPSATGEEGQSTGVELVEKGDTLFVLLDIPLLQDVYDTPGFAVAMTGYLDGWPGGVLWRSEGGGHAWSAIQGFTPPGSTIGRAIDALAEHGGTVLDKSGLLTVRLYGVGELSSVTEAQLFAGSNWFAYGADGRWEIIAAQNCVLQGDGSYILSDFLRGQMGTEWATGDHVAGDKIVLLSSTQLAFISVNSSSIGVEKLFRGVTGGETLDTADDVEWSYDGVNLECLSPCHATGSRHPTSNDWTLTWTRRSRFAGWRNYVDAALGEASESYEVDIYSDNTYTTVMRTLTATSETASYTSAQQVTDFGSAQGRLYLKIYQLSVMVGRGCPLVADIDRRPPILTFLQLHCDGSNGSTTFTDTSDTPKTVTAFGNAQISTAWSSAGTGSALFDGSGDYLKVSSSEFLTGTADFEWNLAFKLNSTASSQILLFLGNVSAYYQLIVGAGQIRVNQGSGGSFGDVLASSQTLDTSAHTLRWVKSGATNELFYDGVSLGTWSSHYSFIAVSDLWIGANPVGNYLNGYIDEITLTQNV